MPNDIHRSASGQAGFTEAGARAFHGKLTAQEAAVLGAFDRARVAPVPADDLGLARQPKNDYGNGRRLLGRHGETLRWTKEVGWIAWDMLRWSIEDGETLAIIRAHETALAVLDERKAIEEKGKLKDETEEEYEERLTALSRWSVSSGNRQRAESMLKSAAPYLVAKIQTFDADPYAFNVLNGTIRLDGERAPDVPAHIYPHNPAARITRLAPVTFDETADCPRWKAYMADLFEGRPETLRYMQKVFGYTLSGDVGEQKVWLLFGTGSNGKSIMIDTLAEMLGDYAQTAKIETFLHQQFASGSGASPDIARMSAIRFLRTSEPDVGGRLNESLIKQVSGGEPLAARHLNRDFFEFRPQLKLLISTNHKLTIVGKDHGIKRRIVIVPFTKQYPVDPRYKAELDAALRAEWPGILNWLLEGMSLWWDEGLRDPPPDVVAATQAYFAEMDPIGSFIEQACKRGSELAEPNAGEGATTLYKAYQVWCENQNETPKEQTAFGRRLNDMGHPVKKVGGFSKRMGLQLRPEHQPQAAMGAGED